MESIQTSIFWCFQLRTKKTSFLDEILSQEAYIFREALFNKTLVKQYADNQGDFLN